MRFLWAWVAAAAGIAGAAPTVAIAPASLSFAYQVGSPYIFPQAVVLAGGQAALFSATRPLQDTWLVLPSGNAASGSIPGGLQIGVDPSGLPVGTYTSTVSFHSTLGDYTLPVSLLVSAAPVLLASPGFVQLSSTDFGPPLTISVGMSNGAAAVLTTTSTAPWLTAIPGSNSVLISTTVSKATAGLNSGAVKVAGSTALGIANNPLSVPVLYVVGTLNNGGPLALSPAALTFSGPGTQTVAVTGPGFSAGTATSWLRAAVSGQSLTVWAAPFAMAAGTYQGTVTLAANGVVELLPVTLTLGADVPGFRYPVRRPREGR